MIKFSVTLLFLAAYSFFNFRNTGGAVGTKTPLSDKAVESFDCSEDDYADLLDITSHQNFFKSYEINWEPLSFINFTPLGRVSINNLLHKQADAQ